MEINKLPFQNKINLFNYLSEFILEKRLSRFNEVIKNRTRHITIVLEDIYQPHNASAVLRSCECFGVQDVHVIENKNQYNVNPDVALGSSKWLSIYKYGKTENNTALCVNSLKEKGYKIIAATPHKNDVLINELPLDNKVALMFGTEVRGLTPEAMDMADGYVKIPMHGFTESFNISVSAAICLYELTERLRRNYSHYYLSDEETIELKIQWILNTVNKPNMLLEKFFSENPINLKD